MHRLRMGWWLEHFIPVFLAVVAIAAAGVWFIRSELLEVSLKHWAWAMALLAILSALAALRFSMRRWRGIDDAWLRLDEAMKMNHRLLAANAGVSAWPDVPERVEMGLHWNLSRVFFPIVLALVCMVLAWALPISQRAELATKVEELAAWQQLGQQLENLRNEEIVDPESLEKKQELLDELRSQDPEQWFSHESLEATDALVEMQGEHTQGMMSNLEQANRTLEQLDEKDAQANQTRREQLAEEFGKQIEQLAQREMKPNPELLEKLKQAVEISSNELTAEQRKKLSEALKNAGEAMQRAIGELPDEFFESETAQQQAGTMAGEGEIRRGPGHDPNLFGKPSDAVELEQFSAIPLDQEAAILPGDVLKLEEREHEVDRSLLPASAGGAIPNSGRGGDRIWRESLDPAEQKVLKQFFE